MNETQAATSDDKVQKVKEPWQETIKKLSGPFKYEEIRASLNDPKYWFTLPDEILTFEGYVKILAHLQNTRNSIIRIKLQIDEHAGMKTAALKNMEKILPGVYSSEECKTDKLREAKAAQELERFTNYVEEAKQLQIMSNSVLTNIDSAIAQVNRQMKAVDMGIRTSAITTTEAKDWDESINIDDEEIIYDDWEKIAADVSNDDEE